ncbi:Uncharacterised protein [Bordetella avium]|nr:hypothetical protein vBBaMIFTN4_64 [Bordetella phage vB_BaM-IFTN4]UOK17330.1 hypothetical protein vBBaMIFTN5_66 [Bordetella phage vB_BaM-IFTN5]UOK17534.1 hypothetical protein vBBaMIFTN8_69 [Bordetella phage vB_BaM-IFTN8]SUV68327.1 Uncharacterised protein [Bordetella avium]
MTIIQKPRARQERGMWLVWCAHIGPSPRATFDEAYRAWATRRGINHSNIGAA